MKLSFSEFVMDHFNFVTVNQKILGESVEVVTVGPCIVDEDMSPLTTR